MYFEGTYVGQYVLCLPTCRSCRNLDLTQQTFVYLLLRRKHLIDRREPSDQRQYPLTGTLFYMFVVMIPHYVFLPPKSMCVHSSR